MTLPTRAHGCTGPVTLPEVPFALISWPPPASSLPSYSPALPPKVPPVVQSITGIITSHPTQQHRHHFCASLPSRPLMQEPRWPAHIFLIPSVAGTLASHLPSLLLLRLFSASPCVFLPPTQTAFFHLLFVSFCCHLGAFLLRAFTLSSVSPCLLYPNCPTISPSLTSLQRPRFLRGPLATSLTARLIFRFFS